MNPTRKAFILGGTGQIGRAIAQRLILAGWRVTLAHRGTQPAPPELLKRGAAVVKVNREEPGALARAKKSSR